MATVTNSTLPPFYFCRQHFYKILAVVVFVLLAAQYSLNVFFYQSNTYFSFNVTSLTHFRTNVTSITTTPSTNSTGVKNGTQTNKTTKAKKAMDNKLDISNLAATTLESRQLLQKKFTEKNETTKLNASLPLCPLVPPKLVGPLKVWTDAPTFDDLEKMHPELELGGRFKPKECRSRHRVAIIIPIRDREQHLRIFLHNMHPMLQRQQLDYGIYVIEQISKTRFNRAMLMNVGYVESLKQYDYDCFIFHDVDLIPEDDRNLYSCPEQPRHMSVAIDVFSYRLPYESLFGGVCAFNKTHMKKVNGFSNLFWGWGGEDDDMSNRVSASGYHISRYKANIARYKMLKHKKQEPNPDRYNVLYKGKKKFKNDGLNTLKYERRDILLKRLFTWVYVDLTKK